MVAGLAIAAAGSAVALAADRPYDAEVRRLIGQAHRGVEGFRKHARREFKSARINVEGVNLDLGRFLDDLRDVGRKLEKRYASEYAAVPDAELFLLRARRTDAFIAGHAGLSGADGEWRLLRSTMISLGKAYALDWESDPATWRPARAPDAPLRRAAAEFEKQAKNFAKALDAAASRAGLNSGHRKVLEDAAQAAVDAAAALRKTIHAGRPPGAALKGAASALVGVEKRVGSEGLTEAVSGSWRQLDQTMKILSGFLGGVAHSQARAISNRHVL